MIVLAFLRILLLALLMLVPGLAWAQSAGWEFPATANYTAGASDNNKALSSQNAPGATITVALPNPNAVAAGWNMGFGTDNGRGITVNAPNGVYILAGQKTLTSLAAPSNQNYEFFQLNSDGTNFRLVAVSRATSLFNGLLGDTGGEGWTYLGSAGYAATAADNGHILSSALTGGATTITLPPAPLVPNGWTLVLYPDGGNNITVQPNAVQGGSLIDPFGTSVASYTSATQAQFIYVSFDGASFRILERYPAGLRAMTGDNTGASGNAIGFAAQIAAAAAAGGAGLIIPEGNWKLESTISDTSGLVGFLVLPGARFSGAGGLTEVTDTAIDTLGWGSFSFLRNEALAGTGSTGTANQANIFVSTNVPSTNSPSNYEKIGLYSRIVTADVSSWTQNVSAGTYTPLIFRDAVSGEFQAQTSTVNAKIFGVHGQCILNADAWCHAGEFEVDNKSAVTQSYLTQPDSMVGVQIVSMNNPITAYLYAGGAANSVDGLVVQADTVTRNVLAAYINPGTKQTTPFRLQAPIGGAGMHLSLSGQITAGYTIPAPGTPPIAVLDCCNFLGHFAPNVNLALGAAGGIAAHYAIRGTTDDGVTGVPIDIISDLFVTQQKSGAGLGETIWNTGVTGTTATTSALTVQTGAAVSAKYVQFVEDDSGAAYLQVGSGTTSFTLYPATIQFPNLPTVAAGTGKRLACFDPVTGKLYAGTGVTCS